MSPLEINFLLHCYYSPEPHERIDAPAMGSVVTNLIAEGLIVANGKDIWKTTDRGNAHVEQLCNLPFPRLEWIGYDGKTIDAQ